jgi:thioredoxin 1
METDYTPAAPARADIDALRGPALLEFGANWCGHCRATQAPLAEALAEGLAQGGANTALAHFKVEDGPGRALGRSFRVKLWPTLIFLRDGQEVARLVRPLDAGAIRDALARLAAPV